MSRVAALVGKELLDVRRNLGVMLPVVVATLALLTIPLAVAVFVPMLSGQSLADDGDLVRASLVIGFDSGLTPDGRIQLFLFQQFLTLFLMIPITGAMAVAAHAIVSEKQARTLEPLLATPLSTFELLLGKVIGALLPTFAISLVGLLLYLTIIAIAAEPGVMMAMVNARSLALVFGVGPMCALVALQFAILISSRVNDARTAQQFGVLIVMPITGLVIAQFTGTLWLTAPMLVLLTVAGLGFWVVLAVLSVILFDREQILTRWK
jgi:ABC-2 type transport system permease protein